jgi:hypothetical protein
MVVSPPLTVTTRPCRCSLCTLTTLRVSPFSPQHPLHLALRGVHHSSREGPVKSIRRRLLRPRLRPRNRMLGPMTLLILIIDLAAVPARTSCRPPRGRPIVRRAAPPGSTAGHLAQGRLLRAQQPAISPVSASSSPSQYDLFLITMPHLPHHLHPSR